MKKCSKSRISFLVIGAVAVLTVSAPAQRKSAAVREPTPGMMIKESSLDYRLWETFVLVRKANDGEAAAQHELGLRYLQGRGFLADTAKAAFWMQKAADQDFDLAHFNLGILTLNGWGVPWNPFVAFGHFERASRRSMPEADFLLGLLYTEDLIVGRDWKRAFSLVSKAADAGYDPARKALAEFRKRGIGSGPASSDDTTRPGQRRPLFLDFDVDTSSTDDAAILNDLLKEGRSELRKALGVDPNLSRQPDSSAIALIRTAAGAGSPEALTILGRFAERGIKARKDRVDAAALYLVAVRNEYFRAYDLLWNLSQETGFAAELEVRAKRNDPAAEFVSAGLVAARIDSRLSGDQALKLLQAAASRQYTEAIIELGLCYQSGRWVTQDRARARQLWEQAASQGSTEAMVRLRAMELFVETPSVSADLLRFFERQSEEGSILAQVALGYCFERGFGVARDNGKAAGFYREAAQRGSESAYEALKRMHDRLRPPGEKWVVG